MEIPEIRAHVQKFLHDGGGTAQLRAAFQSHLDRLLSPNTLQHTTPLGVQRKVEDRAAVVAGIFRKEDDFDRRLVQSSAEPKAFEQELRRFASRTDEFENALASALHSLEVNPAAAKDAEPPLRGLVVKAFDFYERVILGWRENRSQSAEPTPTSEHSTAVVRGAKNETLDELVVCAVSRNDEKVREARTWLN